MPIDFTPIRERTQQVIPFAAQYSQDDIRAAAVESVEFMLGILDGLTDADVVFVPDDPLADDPFAVPEEQHIGWNIAHLVVHVTASTEEYFSVASILARGLNYPREPRLRYETHWTTVTTVAQCEQRLRESLRLRLAFLDAFPDTALGGRWERSERFLEIFGEVNAQAACMLGLSHETGHRDQFIEAKRQALAARTSAG